MIPFGEAHHYIGQYGYAAVALGILLEDFGLPTPGETLLITGAALASRGTLDIWLLLPLAWLGAVVGDGIGFLIGHLGGHRLLVRHGRRIGITEERLDHVRRLFHRYGPIVVVFARFVILARQFNGIVAGMLEMHWAKFMALNALGAALWVGFWGLLAYALGKRIFHMLDQVASYEPGLFVLLGVIFVLALVGHFLFRWLRTRRPRQD